jgi:hypothetical protein
MRYVLFYADLNPLVMNYYLLLCQEIVKKYTVPVYFYL